MKRIAAIILAVLVITGIIILPIVISETIGDGEAKRHMNRIEKRYDADGPFILIDTEAGLMGLYEGSTPAGYIWKRRLCALPRGFYTLSVRDGYIELAPDEQKLPWIIEMGRHDLDIIMEHTPSGTPVLVY